MFFVDWWNSLSGAAQMFALAAIPATVLLVIQIVTMFLGFGEDADGAVVDDGILDDLPEDIPDVGNLSEAADGVFGDNTVTEVQDVAGLEGLKIFTVRGIIAFFVVFGWVGVLMDSGGCPLYATIPSAMLCGFAMMFVLAYIFRAVLKLRNSGNADNRNAVGVTGKVHLTIPAGRRGEGKVHIMLQGAYVERNAVTDEAEPIPTGHEVVVVGVSGQTDLVVKRK